MITKITYFYIAFLIVGILLIILGPITENILISQVKNNIEKSYIITSANVSNFNYIDEYDTEIYAWNVTNPNEILNGNQPIFDIIGPFNYEFFLTTNNPSFNNDGNTFSFSRSYVYSSELINLVNNSFIQKMTSINYGYLFLINLIGSSEELLPIGLDS